MGRGERIRWVNRRKAWILAGVTLIVILLPASLVEPVKLTALTPVVPLERLAHLVRNWFLRYEVPPELRKEEEFLRARLSAMEFENRRLRGATASLHRLEAIDLGRFTPVPGEVVLPRDSSPWRESLVLGVGSRHGIRSGMVVVWERALLGRIGEVGLTTSRVLLASDPKFKAGAVLTLAGASPSHTGFVQGCGDSRLLLYGLLDPPDFDPGTQVYTMADPSTGMPAGLLIGRSIGMDRVGGGYANVMLDAAVRASAVETVFVLVPSGEKK